MEAARAAVSKITGRTGHRTDVNEVVNPAITSETIKPHRHEETTEAIDREVHQDHYHTTVQPIAHKEVLPEQHTHNIIPQVQREFKHDNEQETRSRVQAELGQFQNTSRTHETKHTATAAPQVVGEHVHHHVHETVQPVIHKETIQPEVVHTTVPIHETHHESSKHHGMSALPMKTLDEFTKAGGIVSGSKSHTHEEYEGAPRPYNESLKTSFEKILPGHHGHSSTTGVGGTTTNTTTNTTTSTSIGRSGHNTSGTGVSGTGVTGSGLTGHNTSDTGLTGQNTSGVGYDNRNTVGSGITGHNSSGAGYDVRNPVGSSTTGHNTSNTGYDNKTTTGSGLTGGSSSEYDRRPDSGIGHDQTEQRSKPSLMDRLNPRVDASGDGKAGFMK